MQRVAFIHQQDHRATPGRSALEVERSIAQYAALIRPSALDLIWCYRASLPRTNVGLAAPDLSMCNGAE